jgi:hypothetical protein
MNAQKIFVPTPRSFTSIPIFDAHNHVVPGMTLENIIGPLINRAGVKKIALMCNRAKPDWPIGEEDKLILAVYEKYPDRVIPFLTCQRWGLYIKDRAWLEYADRQLATRKFKGLGQFIVKRYGSHNSNEPGWNKTIFETPLDSKWMQDLMRLAAKHNAPILFTMETTQETLLSLDRALKQNPDAKMIWAHQSHLKEKIGSTASERKLGDPQHIATLLDKHPNLFIDISLGYDHVNRTGDDQQIPEKWRNFYEKYSDRVVIGIDLGSTEGYLGFYVLEAFWFRGWLAQLSESTQKKFAYENIERILLGK